MFWSALKDYHMWPIYLLGLTWLLPTVPIGAYLTLVLRDAGFGTFETNLLTIPAYVLFIAGLLFWTWVSKKLNDIFLVATVSQIWALPVLIALECLPGHRSPWVSWILATLLYAEPYVHAIIVAVTSRNAGSVRTRTTATALYNMVSSGKSVKALMARFITNIVSYQTVQMSNIIGSNVYRTNDAPLYRRGNKVLIALSAYTLVLFVGTKLFYIRINRLVPVLQPVQEYSYTDHYHPENEMRFGVK